jgi:hypothetical protein
VRKTLIVAFVALSLVVGGYLLFIDAIVARAVEGGVRSALGVESSVGLTNLRLFAGELHVRDVRIGNPPGFEGPHFLVVRHGEFEAEPLALLDPVVEVPLAFLEGIEVSLERSGGKTNYGIILENMDSFEETDATEEQAADSQRFVVRRLVIRDVNASVEWSSVATEQTRLQLEIPEIEVRDLGEGGGLTSAQLTDLITKAILDSIYRHGAGLPSSLISGLGAGLGRLDGLPGVVVRGADATFQDVGGRFWDGVRSLFGREEGEEKE